MQNQRHLMVSTLLVALALGACGDDEKKAATTPDAGKPDNNDTDGDPGPQEPTSIECGANTCMAPSLGGDIGVLLGTLGGGGGGESPVGDIAPTVCCAGEDESLCGASSDLLAPGKCFEQGQVGRPASPTCPNLPIPLPIDVISFELKGCCKPSNECGLDLERDRHDGPALAARQSRHRRGHAGAAPGDAL
jgi:hypothetical protein